MNLSCEYLLVVCLVVGLAASQNCTNLSFDVICTSQNDFNDITPIFDRYPGVDICLDGDIQIEALCPSEITFYLQQIITANNVILGQVSPLPFSVTLDLVNISSLTGYIKQGKVLKCPDLLNVDGQVVVNTGIFPALQTVEGVTLNNSMSQIVDLTSVLQPFDLTVIQSQTVNVSGSLINNLDIINNTGNNFLQASSIQSATFQTLIQNANINVTATDIANVQVLCPQAQPTCVGTILVTASSRSTLPTQVSGGLERFQGKLMVSGRSIDIVSDGSELDEAQFAFNAANSITGNLTFGAGVIFNITASIINGTYNIAPLTVAGSSLTADVFNGTLGITINQTVFPDVTLSQASIITIQSDQPALEGPVGLGVQQITTELSSEIPVIATELTSLSALTLTKYGSLSADYLTQISSIEVSGSVSNISIPQVSAIQSVSCTTSCNITTANEAVFGNFTANSVTVLNVPGLTKVTDNLDLETPAVAFSWNLTEVDGNFTVSTCNDNWSPFSQVTTLGQLVIGTMPSSFTMQKSASNVTDLTAGTSFPNLDTIQGSIFGYNVQSFPSIKSLKTVGGNLCLLANAAISIDLSELSFTAIKGSCFVSTNYTLTNCPCGQGCKDQTACTSS